MEEKRILIISNNVLSERRNNGKTILSFIDTIPRCNIHQLYFNAENPSIQGYQYFQIDDCDVIKGRLKHSCRGRTINAVITSKNTNVVSGITSAIKKTPLKRVIRDLLWANGWKSKNLLNWLDDFKPDTIFFVAGDAGFPYNIVNFIQKRYDCRLVTYITDDYIMPRSGERFIASIRRKFIKKKMANCISNSYAYYTVSPSMQKEYEIQFGTSSNILVNMSECLYDESMRKTNTDEFVLVYAGSLYYGRDDVLFCLCQSIQRYNNSTNGRHAVLNIYTSMVTNVFDNKLFSSFDCCKYCGSVSPDELKVIYNQADILVFAESFEPEMVERTKYSLSTKVPEYLSLKKTILAIGPKGIGSIDYLGECALCVNELNDLDEKVRILLSDKEFSLGLCEAAYQKYIKYHNKTKNQKEFIDTLCE